MFFVLSLLLGLLLGLVAGGGSMLAVPVFRYGLGEETAVAFPGALFVVGVASVVGLVLQAREGRVKWAEGSLFAIVSMVGALIGGWVSGWVSKYAPDGLHMVLFAVVLVWAGWKLISQRGLKIERRPGEDVDQKRLIITALGLGLLTGFLAIGGGVLVVSALVVLMRLPVKEAMATSLLVIAANSFAGLAGHLSHVDLPWARLLGIAGIAGCGCALGVALNKRVPVKWLKDTLGWVVLGVAVWVLVREFL